jgi:MYXO-CTERM domain-containing protein
MRISSTALVALAFAAPLAYASTAHAGLEACGNIHVEAEAACEMRTGISCEGSCEPIAFEAQCAANLTAVCEGQCSGELTAQCEGSCQGECTGSCDPQAGVIDCQGSCFANCDAQAQASCADSQCLASAQATCDAECEGSCEAMPPQANCELDCQAVCEGSCTAQANLDCQIECQDPLYVDCQGELSGGCRGECQTEDGALFCDGQYVDHGNNLEDCIAALDAALGIEVTGYASCEGNSCEAGFTCTCSSDPTHSGRNAGIVTLGVLFAFGFARRRKRTA